MTAATHVEEALAKHGLDLQDELMLILIIEELVRLDMKFKKEWIKANEASIASQRINHRCPKVNWVIEDFISGRYYTVPSTLIKCQTQQEIMDFVRCDSVTGKKFDVAAPRCHPVTSQKLQSNEKINE